MSVSSVSQHLSGVFFVTRQVCNYANGLDGSSSPFLSIQKQSTEKLIRMFLEISLLHSADSQKVRLKSNSAPLVFRITSCSLGCHRVIRRNHEIGIVELSTPRQLENEALGFVKDGWTMFEIKIKLFDEAEFDEEIRRISRPLDRMSNRWKEPNPDELMHVEGLSLNNVFLLRWSLSVDGRGEYKKTPYTFVLNKYKYFATYEVCPAKLSPPLRPDPFFVFHSVNCLEVFC